MAKTKTPVLTEQEKRDMRLKEIIIDTFRQYEQYFPQPQDGVIYRRQVVEYAEEAVSKFNAEMAELEAQKEAANGRA